MRTLRFLLPTLLIAGILNSQETVFRTTTRLIQVNVVALDKKGKPVTDLKKEDFVVTDKGKPQTISLFAMEKTSERKPVPKLAKGYFTNYTGGAVSPNLTVILLDTLNTSWGDVAQARQHVMRFLQQIQPNDRVAIMTLGRTLRMMHSFTDDKERLMNVLKGWRGRQDAQGVDADPVVDASFDIFAGAGEGSTEQDFRQSQRILNSLGAMEAVGNYLAGTPGRKNLVWVTSAFPSTIGLVLPPPMQTVAPASQRGAPSVGPPPLPRAPSGNREQRTFSEEIDRTMRLLNNANVAVYPVDARGLSTDPGARINIDTMQEFAGRTGGKAFFNRNDIDTAIRTVLDETEVTYTLAFYPAEDKADGKYRDIKVKVDRPGVELRFRKGYIAEKPEDREKDREVQLRQAARSPIEGTALGMLAQVVKEEGKLKVAVYVDPKSIGLDTVGDHHVGRLDILFLQRDKAGHEYESTKDSLEFNLGAENYAKLMKGGFNYRKEVPLNAKTEFLRIVVRDSNTTLSGSITASW